MAEGTIFPTEQALIRLIPFDLLAIWPKAGECSKISLSHLTWSQDLREASLIMVLPQGPEAEIGFLWQIWPPLSQLHQIHNSTLYSFEPCRQ